MLSSDAVFVTIVKHPSMMAASILSSDSYVTYLDDYVTIILKGTDQCLLDQLNESYLDEIERHAQSIMIRWLHEQPIDEQSCLFIEHVGHLNRKLARLGERHRVNAGQLERIEHLLCNAPTIRIVTSILESLVASNQRHGDRFLRHLSVLIVSLSQLKSARTSLNPVCQRLIESDYYQQGVTDVTSADIQAVHLLFLGAVGQLASSKPDTKRHELYAQFLSQSYKQTHVVDNADLHCCTLGVLSQMNTSLLMQDYPCMSILTSLFIQISSQHVDDSIQALLLPLFHLFNALCLQSKTAACYLNTEPLVDALLHYVTRRGDCRTQLHACLLLGYIVSESQLLQRRIDYKLTMKLIDLLFDYEQETENILASLLSLTIHEQVQFTIAHTYQLTALIRLSQRYPIVYEIIWKLSFHADIVEQLIERHDAFMRLLASLPSSIAAQGILQNVQMKTAPRLPANNSMTCDFSLVASANDQQLVRPIEEKLLKSDFRAGTPANSRCILLCLTEETKHDCSCRAAIRQALRDGKKVLPCIVHQTYRVDDWFGALHVIASGVEKVVGVVQSECRREHSLPAISKRTRIVTPPRQNSQITFTVSPVPQPSPAEASPRPPGRKIQSWTNREVLAWCEKNNLTNFNKILALYDGRSLLALAHVSRMNAPHTIINHLRNDCRKQGLRITFVEFVRFQTALDELLRLERTILRKQSVSTLASRYVYKGRDKQ